MNFAALPTLMDTDIKHELDANALEQAFSFLTRGSEGLADKRIAMLGIPDSELTESVQMALSVLFEKMDDMSEALGKTQTALTEMESLVDVDCLTPLPNRRAFMRRLDWALAMQSRYGHKASLIFFDLNDFKKLNDTYGHAAGDAALQHVATMLNTIKRDSDFMARLGGDEFAVIMFHAGEEDSKRRASQIADQISNTPFDYDGKSIQVKSSAGCYATQPGDTAEFALHQADLAMFADKEMRKAAGDSVRRA